MTTDPQCPECSSRDVMFSKKDRQIHICEDCGHKFTVEKQIIPIRIFISYGRDEYAVLAEQLKKDLEARGHSVWFDAEKLRDGADWEEYIEKGFELVKAGTIYKNLESGVEEIKPGKVIFLMTPHSTRKPDGYCLNEIMKAIINNLKIIPVMVCITEPPLSIYRIQWLDMQDCFPPVEKQGPYERKLERLLNALEEDLLDFEGFHLNLMHVLKPIEFRADILSFLDRFTGRQWVFDKIGDWLRTEEASKVFWITGGPGVGKSAIAAWLRENQNEVKAFHFCNISDQEKNDPVKLIASIAYQLSTQIPAYQHQLKHLDIKGIMDEYKDAMTLFDKLIVQPITADFPEPENKVVILIDALDEASREGRNEIASFIAQEFHKTPKWLRMIITSRPDPEVTFPLQALSPFKLDASSDENVNDLRDYLKRELASYLGEGHEAERMIDEILLKSEGSFLYAKMFCEEISAGRLSLENASQFPQGLGGLYGQFFDRKFKERLREYSDKVRPALSVILASCEPIQTGLLRDLFGWDTVRLAELCTLVGSLFPFTGEKNEGVIQPFHRSVKDWITDMTKAGDYVIDLANGHQVLADFGWKIYREEQSSLRQYFVSYLPDHLMQAGRIDDLGHLLSDIRYIETAWPLIPLKIIQYWADLENNTSYRMVDAYRPAIDNPDNYEEQTIFNIADLLRDSCYPQEEMLLREYLVKLNKEQNDMPELIQALIDLGKCKRHVGKNREAIEHYLEAKEVGERTGYDALLADSAYEIGDLYRSVGDYSYAGEILEPLIKMYSVQKRWKHYAKGIRKLMLVLRHKGEYGKALSLGMAARQLVSDMQAPEAEAGILISLSACARAMKQREKARDFFEEATHKIESLPKESLNRDAIQLKGEILLEKARNLHEAECMVEAFEVRVTAFKLFEEIKDYANMSLTVNSQLSYYRNNGQDDEYCSCVEREYSLAKRSGDLWRLKAVLHNRGFTYQLRGEYSDALSYYNECIKICDETGLYSMVTHGNIAQIWNFTGKFNASIEKYINLLDLAQDKNKKNSIWIRRCNRQLFQNCLLIGDIEKAKSYASEYMKIASDVFEGFNEYDDSHVEMLISMGQMYTEEGKEDKVFELVEKIENNYISLNNSRKVAIVLKHTKIAKLFLLNLKAQIAEDRLMKSYEYWQSAGTPLEKSNYLGTLAMLRFIQQNYTDALNFAQRAFHYHSQMNVYHQAESALLLSRIYLALEQPDQAREKLLFASMKFNEYSQKHRVAESKIVEAQLILAETGDKGKAVGLIEEGRNTLFNMGWIRLARWAEQELGKII